MDTKTHLSRWRKMLKNVYKERQAVLRVKTELDAKNPAVRDWAAFRIVDKPNHPLEKKAKLWPLYNFASAIDDHLCNVTHIFRGQEHSTNETKQRYLYQHFKWNYPNVIILGRFSLSDMVLSKSRIREGIQKHIYTDWDDPNLGTIRALRRRGFQPEALRQIIVDIGPKPSDITLSFENLSAYNRKLIDKIANRYFFIQNPKKIEVKGLKLKQVKIPLHPDVKRGYRKFSLSKTFYIDADDFEGYKGLEIRLKDLCNIKLENVSQFTGTELKSLPKIQWVPAKHLLVKIRMPDKEIKGIGEMNLTKAKVGDIIQFERFGFVRIEKITKGNVFVVFSHE
jgi:glutamyl-tRNA synthetase